MKVTILEKRPGVFRLRIETVDGATGERKFAYETVKGTSDDAARRRHAILAKYEEGSWSDPSRLTVARFLETWLENKLAMGVIGKLTHDNQWAMIRKWIMPACGATRLQRLKAEQIQDLYKDMIKKGLAAITVAALHKNVMVPAMRDARKSRLVVVNVLEEVTPPRAGRTEPKALDPAAVERILRGLTGSWIEHISLFALGTGLRRGEACGLRWKDVDLAARVVHVRGEIVQFQTKEAGWIWKEPKTLAGVRTVSLPAPLVEMLTELRATVASRNLAELREGYVFTDGGLAPMMPRAVSSAFKAIARKCGVEGRGAFHRLRHTHITVLLRNVGKEGAKAVSQRVGHANVMITLNVYQTVFEGEDKGLADLAAGLFAGRAK